MTITRQKPNTDWQDEAGNLLTFDQVTKKEKVYEKITFDVAKAALKANEQLKKLKGFIMASIKKATDAFHDQYKGKKTEFKGNYTITNFDQSIKVLVSVSNPIRFDDMTIQQAKSLLDDFLKDGISAKNSYIKDMVLSAFETRRGQMDVKKIMSLKRYADRISDERYKEAMQLIDSAIRRPDTATYYRVEIRNEEGKYENIALSIADV
jgi:hypothetical protein